MTYCTVGDHMHDQNEKVLPFGKWQGHAACPQCYVATYIESVRDREKEKAARKLDFQRKMEAIKRERARVI